MEKYYLRSFIVLLLCIFIGTSSAQSDEQTTPATGGTLGNTADFTSAQSIEPPRPHSGESILFLGNFGFDLDNDNSVTGGTSFRDFLLGQGYTITESSAPAISSDLLAQYTAVVFSDDPGSLSPTEAGEFSAYVNTHGGNLLLLGQMTGYSSYDRNLVGEYFGINFYDDLFCDPSNHINYNGGCSPGDPDNGVEYPLLSVFADHPVTRNVSSFLLNWGQSLTLSGSAQAVASGTANSWSDQDANYVPRPSGCFDGWYVNTDDRDERHGYLPGIAVYESGGKVVAIGDNDMLWNYHFPGNERTLMGNVFDWFFTPTLISPPDGYYTTDTTPRLDWSDVFGATEYDLQIDNNADFSSPLVETDRLVSWYESEIGFPRDTYYWRVRANNLDGTGEWSAVSTFSITRIPTLVSPANGSQITDNTPLCTWTNGIGFQYYFQLSTVSDFRTIVEQGSSSGTSYQVGSQLAPGTYYWRVGVYGTAGDFGGRSSTFSFEVLPPEVDVTVTTSPVGRQIIVDRQVYTAPQTFQWQPGSQHTVEVSTPQSGGTGIQYVYDRWSDQGARSHTVTTPGNGGTLIAYFDTQYRLTMIAGSGGTVSPASGWYEYEAEVEISATPNSGFDFLEWAGTGSGSYTGTNNPALVSIDGPVTQTATFSQIIVTQPNGGEVLYVGTTYDITWTEQNIPYVYIEYSTNGGQTWLPVASEITQNSYSWTVPNTPSSNCIIRVIENTHGIIYDDSDSPFTISIGEPITITTNHAGMEVVVDGITRAAPITFHWIPGSIHNIGATLYQDGGTGRRFVFNNWSDGGGQYHSITTPGTATTYTANYDIEYELEMVADAGGSVDPQTDWYPSGAEVEISATAQNGYYFSNWQGAGIGSYSGANNPATITMNSGISQTAYFNPLVASTITTSPSGRNIDVDGENYTSPQTFLWQPGTQHTIGVTSPQIGGTGIQYVFNNWSDNGIQTHTITAPAQETTFTAFMNTEYYLTMDAWPGGNVEPSSGWYGSGANVQITATEDPGYYFTGWSGSGSGSYNGGDNPASVTMSGPITETALFSALSNITVTSFPVGRNIVVDGQTYTAPQVFQWQEGSQHTISTSTPQVIGGVTRYIYNNWSDGGGITHTIVIPGSSATYTANFNTEHYLEMDASTGGSIIPSSDWYGEGSVVQILATADGGYFFTGWTGAGTGSYTGTNNPQNITISGPISEYAEFTALSNITITSTPTGRDVIVDGQTYTAPQIFQWQPGSSHSVDVTSPQVVGNTRYLYNGWSDGGAQNHNITTPQTDDTYTVDFNTEHYLTMNAGTGGSVSPESDWHSQGESIEISATADAQYYFTSWSGTGTGSYTGTGNPVNINMDGPITQTANFSPLSGITITTSPSGLEIIVDSQNYTAPQTFQWQQGTVHTIGVNSPQDGTTGIQYVFGSWEDGGSQTHQITTPGEARTYTAYFTDEYLLTMNAGTGGSVSPESDWYSSGANVEISATENAGYYFTEWTGSGSGSYSGTDNPANVIMNGPVTETANFAALSDITVTSSPAGRDVVIDGQPYTAPQSFQWLPGSQHSISVSSPQSGGTGIQFSFNNWSDGGGQTHQITIPTGSGTYTANFDTEYLLTMNTSTGGSVNPGNGWYDSGENVQISASADGGYYFTGWTGTGTGSYSGSNNPASVTMNGPISETANFSQLSGIVVTTVPAGREILVDGQNYTAPQTFQWQQGTQHTIGVNSSQDGGTGIRYVYNNWSDGGNQTHTITAPAQATTYIASFDTEFLLSMNTGTGGSVAPPSGWYASGANVEITATSDNGYYFTGWTGTGNGSYSGNDNPGSVTMNGPVTETAAFIVNPGVTVTTAPEGLQILIDGNNYTAPHTFSWIPGSSHEISVTSSQSGSQGIRYMFQNWSDGGGRTHTITAPAQAITYTASYGTEYLLTMNAGSGGSTAPPSGWYASGATVEITATSDNGYYFTGWSGTGNDSYTGNNNPASVTMNGPVSETANFTSNPEFTVATMPSGLQITVDGADYTAPHSFSWSPGTNHEFGVASPQSGGEGIQYVYSNWSDNGAQTHTISAPNQATTITANFSTEYYLTMNALEGGSVTPTSGWYTSGTSVQISATAGGGYYFAGWTSTGTGSYSGNDNPGTVTMNGPITQTANFAALSEITIITSPAGLDIIIDGNDYKAPQTFQWTPNDPHEIGVNSPQSGEKGTRYVFSSWSDAGGQTHQITTPANTLSLTANFTTEHLLVVEPGDFDNKFAGMVDTSGTGWYTENDSVAISITPDTLEITIDNIDYKQYFTGWDPALPNYPADATTARIFMDGPKTITATWSTMTITDIDFETIEIPKEFVLDQNYPNPFNPSTTIRYGLPKPADIRITLYNILGQKTSIIVDEFKTAGYHSVTLNGSQMAAGIYFVVFESDNFRAVKKMILLK